MPIQFFHNRIRRLLRYHWLTERLQYEIRRRPSLQLQLQSSQLPIHVKPEDVIIDCGANVGDIASLFARTGARIYAFEPNPVCFSILRRRFKAMPTVHCFNQGVMDSDCVLVLSTPEAHETPWHVKLDSIDATTGASFVPGALDEAAYGVNRQHIACIDLAAFIRSVGHVKLLKLDIEGAEIPVLNHLLDTQAIDAVELTVVETHEQLIPSLADKTMMLRERIERAGLAAKIRLDWP